MRTVARRIVVEAAALAGLGSSRVKDKPETEEEPILADYPVLEFETIDEALERKGGPFAVLPGSDPEKYFRLRRRSYARRLTVRLAIKSDDAAWLESFVTAFLAALPKSDSDEDGNLVKVTAEKAQRSGFEVPTVMVAAEYEAAVWVRFDGGVYSDEERPYILEVDLKDGMSITRS